MYRFRVAFHFGAWHFAIFQVFDGAYEQIEGPNRDYRTEDLARAAAVRRIRRLEVIDRAAIVEN